MQHRMESTERGCLMAKERRTMDDLLAAIRVNSAVWIETLIKDFGWPLYETNSKASRHLDRIGTAKAATGIDYPVYLAASIYTPGESGDKQIELMLHTLSQRHDHCAVVFNRPLLHSTSDGQGGHSAVIFGGLLYEDREWVQFAHVPGRGFEKALEIAYRAGKLLDSNPPSYASLGLWGDSPETAKLGHRLLNALDGIDNSTSEKMEFWTLLPSAYWYLSSANLELLEILSAMIDLKEGKERLKPKSPYGHNRSWPQKRR